MNKEKLSSDLLAVHPQAGEFVYIERRGDEYDWERTASGGYKAAVGPGDTLPDAWIYYSGNWPADDLEGWTRFFDDLMDEMEAMAGSGENRCRWDFDDPWPHFH